MRPLGAGILGSHSSLDPREREILIDRTCAHCGCEYEWGVHVAAYGEAVGLDRTQLEERSMELSQRRCGRSANTC
ncbi:carboxymuconolactone decarboxylase family protein [Ktedonobacter robiniae]|uniref:Carboxymuconolactone decarboxylase-like domain-containing protein n=1 Tax=Ktedonobacter robiniae TaxID=2778365 RepID=A0ABQ3V6T1_9CHLR|nr:carboxymuconolactone decarboxylase family protein [Ktedonobacter robiniae]GHO60482.1 hypothetical protein KSB_89570 [Ktedonobacter robiniae]